MKQIYTAIAIATIAFAACKQSASPTEKSDRIDTGITQAQSSAIETQKPDTLPGMDTTRLVVDSMVNISFNGTPLQGKAASLSSTIYNNWLQAYQAGGHLPVALKMQTIGTVMMGARGNIMDEIVKAQNDMKNYIAKDKFKKSFAQLTVVEQQSLQQAHGILFQKDFH